MSSYSHCVGDEKEKPRHSGRLVVAVNDQGSFFNAKLGDKVLTVGRRAPMGNTLRAQATILIHELGHLMNGIAAPKPVRFCPAIARWIRLNSRSWRSADECSIIGRVTESWQQGSTRAARQPSIRACASWSRTEGDRKHNHLDPPQPNRTPDAFCRSLGIPGQGERDSGVNANTIPG